MAGLAQWTLAMRDFYFVNVIVLPLINSQQRMEAKHTKATQELAEAEEKLEAVVTEVNGKKAELAVVSVSAAHKHKKRKKKRKKRAQIV